MVLDDATVKVAKNSEIIVVSDIHLTSRDNSTDSWTLHELVRAIQKLPSSSVVVLNGDILDLWQEAQTVASIIQNHKEFFDLLKQFSGHSGNELVYVIGNHDGRLAWDKEAQKALVDATGASLCLATTLEVDGKKLRVVHGNQFDPDNAFRDPRDPYDTPFGQHVVQDVLPQVKKFNLSITQGIDYLAEPHAYSELLFARLFYGIFLPVLLTVGGIFLLALLWLITQNKTQDVASYVGWIALVDSAVVLIGAAIGANAMAGKLNRRAVKNDKASHNNKPKAEAMKIIDNGGLGMISGHTHAGEVQQVHEGLYANSGFCDESLARFGVRFGLPDTFLMIKHISWLHISFSDSTVRAVLLESQLPLKPLTTTAKLFYKSVDFHKLKRTQSVILKV